MNGGAPGALPLRALRHAPVLVDDFGTIPRLSAAAVGVDAHAATPTNAAELVRWTRAWLVVCQGMLHGANLIGMVAPWTVSIALAEVPTLKGDPRRHRRAAAVALLDRAGLLERSGNGASVCFSEALFTTHRAGLEIEWATACRACRYEPAPLLALRALSELVTPLDSPTPVALRELADRTGYAEKQVRVALRRLVESDVLRVTEAAGQAARYRLSDAVLGRGRINGPPDHRVALVDVGSAALLPPPFPAAAAPPRPTHTHADVPVPDSAPRSSTSGSTAISLRVTLNGVTLNLASGLSADVAYDEDGIPHLTFPPRAPGTG